MHRIARRMYRPIFLALLAILTIPADAATADVVRCDSLTEKNLKTSAVAMKSDSIIEDNTLVIANEVKSGDATRRKRSRLTKQMIGHCHGKSLLLFFILSLPYLLVSGSKLPYLPEQIKDEVKK